MSDTPTADSASTLLILSLVIFNFISFISIGIPLAVLPGYVHESLAFSATVAGIVIGVQYLVTLLCRPLAGRLADELGARKTVMIGMLSCAASGVLLFIAAWLTAWPVASLVILLVSRVLLGFTQSLIGISAISWGLNTLGAAHTPRIISWNGIAAYGGVGVGAPLGVLLADTLGFWSLGALTLLLSLTGYYLASRKGPAPLNPGKRLPFGQVLWKVMPHGLSLALGTMGYGTLSAFIALYYAARGWDGAAWCLTTYACTFIGTRLLFPNLINRVGGYPVAIACLAVETLGLALLWAANTPTVTLVGAALTGCGLSLLYPALGVGVVSRVGGTNGSAGLSVFAMFFDLALGLAGAIMGVLATWAGLRSVFLAALLMAIGGLLIAWTLDRAQRRLEQAPPSR
ncbi:MFS transporter [Stutzerimonas urumqiensis]|uniref:MFS transporter n=1 Tax=Stutzerimonas urumqiensis TaxID=638269 RepID=UPI000EAF2024|nr:MFS transporter [Stutzerimonas urumqiensis]